MSGGRFPNRSVPCDHSHLRYTPSNHAAEVGYRRPTDQQRAVAAGRKITTEIESGRLFPAPLLLPGDDLSSDPQCLSQTFRSWLREKDRNPVTYNRNVIYIAGPPEIGSDVDYVGNWTVPDGKVATTDSGTLRPAVKDVMFYLAAFYHGISVKTLPPGVLRFSKWDAHSKRKAHAGGPYIGLDTQTESVRIRVRPSLDGVFQGQLNLDDMLDTAISILPNDAFALLMLVEHDLFEDEDDDFCCGRAYGGSRVAVVSMARYNPNLDNYQEVERLHAWPASHCEAYVLSACGLDANRTATQHRKAKVDFVSHASPSFANDSIPLQTAVTAHIAIPNPDLAGLWFSRVCQTASHELGHCFGIAHCTYYACAMQSTSSLAEDVRQPPYLCPVDLIKVLRATGADERDRYEALLAFCRNHPTVPMFSAFGAWLQSRIQMYEGPAERPDSRTGSKGKPIEL